MTDATLAAQGVEDAQKPAKDEFASVTISLDHLYNEARTDGHVLIKCVFSTQTAVESLLGQMRYFGQSALMDRREVRLMVHDLDHTAGAFVYHPKPDLTNVIVDIKHFNEVLDNDQLGGTFMETCQSFAVLASDMRKRALNLGDPTPIQVFVPHDAENP